MPTATPLPRSAPLVAALALAGPGLAQATIDVFPGQPGGIAAAIAAATPSDLLLVHAGLYGGFAATQGVHLLAEPGVAMFGGMTADVPAGQTLTVTGFAFDHPATVLAGRVALVDCALRDQLAALTVAGGEVQLVDCDLLTGQGGPAADVANATVTAVGCAFHGLFATGSLNPTVRLGNARLHASHCTFDNGQAGAFSVAGPALQALSGSVAWLSDSSLTTSSPIDCAIVTSGANVFTDRCQISQVVATCAPTTPLPLLGVEATPLRLSQAWTIHFTTTANTPLAVFAATDLATVDVPPLFAQPSWLDPASAFAVTVLLADATGDATATFAIPANPLLLGARLWLEGLGGFALPLAVSPVTGGAVR